MICCRGRSARCRDRIVYFVLVFIAAYALLTAYVRSRTPNAFDVCSPHADAVKGGTYIVTGGSSGIGFETVRAIAKCGGHVIVAARSQERAARAIARIEDAEARSRIAFVHLDLSSLKSAERFTSEISKMKNLPPLHGLILNGGVFSPNLHFTADGVEQTYQVNYLSHHALTMMLLEWAAQTQTSRPIRVVAVSSSSVAISTGRITPYDHRYPPFGFRAYADSKACMFRFVRELSRRNPDRVLAYAVHPGLISTGIGLSRSTSVFSKLERVGAALFWASLGPFTKSQEQGAATTVHCAVSPDVGRELNGAWFQDLRAWLPDGPDVDTAAMEDDYNGTMDFSEHRDRLQWEYAIDTMSRIRAGDFLVPDISNKHITSSWVWAISNLCTALLYSDKMTLLHAAAVALAHCAMYALFFGVTNLLFGRRENSDESKGSSSEVRRFGLYKIVPRFPNKNLISREKRRTMYSALIDATYHIAFVASGVVGPDIATESQPTSPRSLLRYALILSFWGTTHFYFTHRLLHTSWLYKNVHISHHESTNPGPWSSTSFHPIEGIIFFSQYFVVLAYPLSWSMWCALKVGVVVGTLNGHLGFDLGIWQGPLHHYHHHYKKRVNYGGWPYGLWDKVMKTDNDYVMKPNEVRDDANEAIREILIALLAAMPMLGLLRVGNFFLMLLSTSARAVLFFPAALGISLAVHRGLFRVWNPVPSTPFLRSALTILAFSCAVHTI